MEFGLMHFFESIIKNPIASGQDIVLVIIVGIIHLVNIVTLVSKVRHRE